MHQSRLRNAALPRLTARACSEGGDHLEAPSRLTDSQFVRVRITLDRLLYTRTMLQARASFPNQRSYSEKHTCATLIMIIQPLLSWIQSIYSEKLLRWASFNLFIPLLHQMCSVFFVAERGMHLYYWLLYYFHRSVWLTYTRRCEASRGMFWHVTPALT